MTAALNGVYAAMLTPLLDDGAVDHRGLAALADWLIGNGCHGVVLFGTTGEGSSFSLAERQAALSAVAADRDGARSIIACTGCCALPDTVQLTRHAMNLGCAAVLVQPPFYFKTVAEDGLYRYYAELIAQVPEARVLAYHFPDMTAVPVEQSLIARLVEAFPEQIVGIKDSGGDLDHMIGYAKAFPELAVMSGDDHLLWPLLEAGGAGAITATANIAPHDLRLVFDGWQEGGEEAAAAHGRLERLWAEHILDFPVTEALKEILATECDAPQWLNLRLPLTRLAEAERKRLIDGYRRLDFTPPPGLETILAPAR